MTTSVRRTGQARFLRSDRVWPVRRTRLAPKLRCTQPDGYILNLFSRKIAKNVGYTLRIGKTLRATAFTGTIVIDKDW